MKLLNYNIITLLVLFLFTNCNEKSKDARYNTLNSELKKSYQLTVDKTIKQILFINDEGCPNCVTSFSNYVLGNIDKYKDSTLIVITSKGVNVDLDRFASLGLENVIISRDVRHQSDIMPDLGVIYMTQEGNVIDTIVSVDAVTFGDRVGYIANRK